MVEESWVPRAFLSNSFRTLDFRQGVVAVKPRKKRFKALLSTRKTGAKIMPCCTYGTRDKGELQGKT